MRFEPLGDQAVLAYCPDENSAVRFAYQARAEDFPWVVDVVQAYASVAVFYDLDVIDYTKAHDRLARMETAPTRYEVEARFFTIPCCYERGLDWRLLQQHTGLASEEIIRLHCQTAYTVYAIGFCPGFPYMGYLHEKITGV